MKKVYSIILLSIGAYLFFCAGCMRFRMSDSKAKKAFSRKDVPLKIYDTVIENHSLHYVISGDDNLPTLVFIHGSPGSWSNYAQYLSDADLLKKFRMLSVDRPGFGYSDFGDPMHLKEQSALLLNIVTAHPNGQPIYLAGHSIGGPVVAQMSAISSGSFKKIVIMSGSISPYLEQKETWRHLMNNVIMRRFLPGAFAPSNTEIIWFKKDLIQLKKELPHITDPVIFIHGDNDSWVPIGNVAYGKEHMTNAPSIEVDTMKGEGHLIPWRRFDQIKEILLGLY